MIEASRDYVCVRPQTYENAAELEVLSYVFSVRGELQNTSFALLDPDGEKLTRGARSPSMTFGDADGLARAMRSTYAGYAAKAKPIEALPVVRDLRLGLNVAAADMRPLVVVRAGTGADARELASEVARVAWSTSVVGACHYVVLEGEQAFGGLSPEPGVTVVQPDPYGRGGEVLTHVDREAASSPALASSIDRGVGAFSAEARRHDEHVREARRRGISWETETPVTDSHAKDRPRRRPDGRGPRGRRDRRDG
ncbi:MAG: hypothetical protein AAGB93_06130 [Planctomycetota bacterium]